MTSKDSLTISTFCKVSIKFVVNFLTLYNSRKSKEKNNSINIILRTKHITWYYLAFLIIRVIGFILLKKNQHGNYTIEITEIKYYTTITRMNVENEKTI